MSVTIPSSDWVRELQRFTDRNCGRITRLEETVGQETLDEERGYPLRGVAYDPRDDRIDIMLGDLEGTEHHLTRGISHVHHIELVSSPQGRDLSLRVRRIDGATTLRFFDNYA